jgi:TATA-binding protein-associated factor
LELDDLSASTGSVMKLLSKFYELIFNEMENKKYFDIIYNNDLKKLIPRLYPFLRHNLIIVRTNCIQTLNNLLNINDMNLIIDITEDLLRYIFQNIILEKEVK